MSDKDADDEDVVGSTMDITARYVCRSTKGHVKMESSHELIENTVTYH